MAAALALHLELEVTETGQFGVHSELAVPTGRENLCVRAFERLHPADGFSFQIRSQIPLSGGLGSSASRRSVCSTTGFSPRSPVRGRRRARSSPR